MSKKIINIIFVIALLSSFIVNVQLLRKKKDNSIFAISNQNYQVNFSRILDLHEYTSQRTLLPIENRIVYISADSLNFLYLSDLVQDKTLVSTFSLGMCESCVDFAVEKLEQHFPDYMNNDRILFIPIDIQARFRKEYFGKALINLVQPPNLLFEGAEKHPCFFLLDEEMIVKMLFVPDYHTSELTDMYLGSIKSRFF